MGYTFACGSVTQQVLIFFTIYSGFFYSFKTQLFDFSLTYLFFVIIYIYTQCIMVNNNKDKNGGLKLIEFRSFNFDFLL